MANILKRHHSRYFATVCITHQSVFIKTRFKVREIRKAAVALNIQNESKPLIMLNDLSSASLEHLERSLQNNSFFLPSDDEDERTVRIFRTLCETHHQRQANVKYLGVILSFNEEHNRPPACYTIRTQYIKASNIYRLEIARFDNQSTPDGINILKNMPRGATLSNSRDLILRYIRTISECEELLLSGEYFNESEVAGSYFASLSPIAPSIPDLLDNERDPSRN